MKSDGIDIGARRQLFIDERFIEKRQGILLSVNPPVKTGPIDLSIEAVGMPSIVEYDGQYYMYYRGREHGTGMAVALSSDGENWTNPDVEMGPAPKGIILPKVDAGGVFIDPRPNDGFPFKGIFDIWDAPFWGLDPAITGRTVPAGMTQAASLGGLFLFRSHDGFKWEVIPEMPVPFLCDTQNQVFFDSRIEKYVAYLRGFPEQEGMPHRYKRIVVRTETADLMDMPWPFTPNPANTPAPKHKYPYIGDEMEVVMAADEDDPQRTDLYNPAMHLYPYAEDVYVAFPSMYRNCDSVPSYGRDLRGIGFNTGLFETQLAVSRDGHTFRRFREPYVRSGLIRDRKGFEGELDCGMIMMGVGMIRSGDRLFQYFYGTGRLHGGASVAEEDAFPGSAVFRAVQRLDGFVSVDTDHKGGEIVTPKITFSGNRLYLNADCGGLGEIWVEIQDAGGTALPGYSMDEAVSIDRNGTAQEIWWKNGPDTGGLAGQPVRLRFKMRSAKLYAFQFVARSSG